MIRAVAANPDEARLCGISPGLVASITWGIAGALSTFTAVLAAPANAAGNSIGGLGSTQLYLGLGAAAFGSFISIPWALAGGVVIGIITQFTVFETSDRGIAEVVVFLVILGVVFARGRAIGSVFAADGAVADDRSPIRIPPGVRDRFVVRHRGGVLAGGGLAVALAAPFVPALSSDSARFSLALIIVYAVIGISLTLLLGWAGQLSLGHVAVMGIGAFVGARQALEGRSVIALLIMTAVLGAAAMIAVGLPALRVRGLTLAVTTLGFGIVATNWLFREDWFVGSPTGFVYLEGALPPLRGLDPDGTLPVYWTALATLGVVAAAAGALRRSTFGRLVIAVRDDEAAAASHGVNPAAIKLTILGCSGAIAGMAGVLWADVWQTVSPTQFPPELSITLLAIPVVGGLGSVAGAIGAAVVLYFPVLFWSSYLDRVFGDVAQTAFQLLFSGINVLIVLLVFPTGLAGGIQRMVERRFAAMAGAGDDELDSDEVAPASELIERDVRPAIEADGIELSFGGIRALTKATISVQPGEIVGLIGPNGAGKSTLINVLSGVHEPDAGRVYLNGVDVTDDPPELRAEAGLGRTFQAASLFPGLTVHEAVRAVLGVGARTDLVSSIIGAPWARNTERRIALEADELLARMGLTPWAHTLTGELSTGTRRICDLALQLAGRPKVLLLDEPTAGVAQRDAEAFGPLLRQLRDELDCAIVIVEHDMPLLMGLCDRVYALVLGAVIVEGTPDIVRNHPDVIASYLGTDATAIERSGPLEVR
jgi:ABC-type branched-subunit amino acid transport system ATPase component/ABC-type branched-subunit amino acid transport system permease subunit